MNKGVYNGKRYVSEKWIELASSIHSDNSKSANHDPDWSVGYGFQVWRNAEEGFRGDGAYGQYMMVLPEREMVVAIRAESGNLQLELDLAKQLVKDLHNATDEVVSIPETCEVLEQKDSSFIYEKMNFRLSENEIGASFLNVFKDNDDLVIELSNSERIISIKAGNGRYIDSSFTASAMRPSHAWRYIKNATEEVSYSCCYNIENDVINVIVKSLNSPHSGKIKFTFDENTREIKMEFLFHEAVLFPKMREIIGTEY